MNNFYGKFPFNKNITLYDVKLKEKQKSLRRKAITYEGLRSLTEFACPCCNFKIDWLL